MAKSDRTVAKVGTTVFVSHSTQDKELARDIARRLRELGLVPFLAEEINATLNWRAHLRERGGMALLELCHALVKGCPPVGRVLLTPQRLRALHGERDARRGDDVVLLLPEDPDRSAAALRATEIT